MALGVLLFLANCSTTEVTDVFGLDRNVTGLNIPALDTTRLKTLPADKSGWQLTWTPPLSPTNWQRTYIFYDTLPSDEVAKLKNGGELAQDFHTRFATVPDSVLAFDIPTSVLTDTLDCKSGCQGTKAPTSRAFWFTVWAQYADGNIGQPVRYRLFLGDEYPPTLPAIRRTIGSDTALFAWDSVFDQTSRFSTRQFGQLHSIRWQLWRGLYQRDTASVKLTQLRHQDGEVWSKADVDLVRSATDTVAWIDSLADSTAINQPGFRLHLSGLRPYRTYTLLIQYVDRFGKTSTSIAQAFTTRDSLPPEGVSGIKATALTPTLAEVSFSAPCDTFDRSGNALTSLYPNRGIQWITAILNGQRVDSLKIAGDSTIGAGTSLESDNWTWNGKTWIWTWGSMDPGSTNSVRFEVSDLSGNPQRSPTPATSFSMPRDPSVNGLSCDSGYTAVGKGWTLVGTDTVQVPAYCMETWPRSTAGRLVDQTTWDAAVQTCAEENALVCSESQWQHACEGTGDSTALHYGVTGLPAASDSIALLTERCGLFSGDSSWLSRRDPRCLGPWGIRGLAGPLQEVVSGSYSSHAAFAGVHVLKGGSWLTPYNTTVAKASVACRYRNYPAFSDSVYVVTGTDSTKVPRPRTGLGKDLTYRCCKPLTAAAGRRLSLP